MAASAMSRAGLSYRSASGEPIQNLGQTMVRFRNGEHQRCHVPFQLAAVERPLVSVARLVDAGNQVYFGPSGGYIAHLATGRKLPLVREGNSYILDMEVEEEKEASASEPHGAGTLKAEGPSGFTRQERR